MSQTFPFVVYVCSLIKNSKSFQKGGAIVRPDDLSVGSKKGGSDGGALVLKGNPDVIIVLVLGESNLLHIQQLAETAEKYQKLAGTPVITQYEIILHRFLVGYIIPSPNPDSSPGMGGALSVLMEIDDICRKRCWKKVTIICHPDHIRLFQQQLEGLGLTVIESIPVP